MSNENIATFNLLMTRAIAELYKTHPAAISLGSYDLWEPRLSPEEGDYETKRSAADGTLTWLYRNGFVGGTLQDLGDSVAIMRAQLTAHGFQIANKSEANAEGKTLGQVAIEAMSDPTSRDGQVGIALIARRFASD